MGIRKPPSYVRDSLKRQYSGKGYTTEDKIRVINWYKKDQAKRKVNSVNA